MKAGTEVLQPPLLRAALSQGQGRYRYCQGTCMISGNLVRMMMVERLEVVDLGVDVPPEKFVETAPKQMRI